MASYSTMPDLESEATLLNKPKAKTSFKTLVGGAAIAAFVLGALPASAVSTPSAAVRAPAMHFKSAAPSVQAPVLDGKSDEIYQHRQCGPSWMKHPLKVPAAFRDVPSAFLPDFEKNFEFVEPYSKDYCDAFTALDERETCKLSSGTLSCPGASLFGDAGEAYPGLGGLNNFAVVKVKSDDFALYSSRNRGGIASDGNFGPEDDESDLWNAWFADENAIRGPNVTFSEYANDRVAIATPKTDLIKCTMKPGALMVVGSGAWRSITKSWSLWMGSHNSVHNPKFDGPTERPSWVLDPADMPEKNSDYRTDYKTIQTPEARFLQYVINVKDAANDCSLFPMDYDNLWNSLTNEEAKFYENGKYVGNF